jgi:hypothetical protein
MTIKEPEVMRQLHKIREESYKEMKNLSPKERIEKIRREAEAFIKDCDGKYPLPEPERTRFLKSKALE